ncbi:DUF397 domain-containing protein [Streptomyces sp. NPDC013978]|uniref:DUF397 domain-containing protein n=1 Tax=Streptomyces sp. NPDC013978 TaxID=3364869 RepID=UPI0036F96CFC
MHRGVRHQRGCHQHGSKNPTGPHLTLSPTAWATFLSNDGGGWKHGRPELISGAVDVSDTALRKPLMCLYAVALRDAGVVGEADE